MLRRRLNIAFVGPSLLSAYSSAAASYYHGILRCLHKRGHRITYYEPGARGRRQYYDLPDPDWVRMVPYAGEEGFYQVLEEAQTADLVIKVRDTATFSQWLNEAVLELRSATTLVALWDVGTRASLAHLAPAAADAFYELVPLYDLILTRSGGRLVETYEALGARNCITIYPALDPEAHYPVLTDQRFQGALGFLGNRAPGVETAVNEYFLKPAAALAPQRFLLGGRGWDNQIMPANVRYLGSVAEEDRNAFNCSPLAILSVNAAGHDFSPPAQLFAAAGVGACLIINKWDGVEHFLKPGREILVADGGEDVINQLNYLTVLHAQEIGEAARRRILAEHTYTHRAAQLEALLNSVKVMN